MATTGVYDYFKSQIVQAAFNMASAAIKAALVNGYTPNFATHQFYSDLTGELATGGGYTAGGIALTSQTVANDTANNRMKFNAANLTWSGATFSATGIVLYQSTGVTTTSILICYLDFGGTKTASGGNFNVNWDATNGILDLT